MIIKHKTTAMFYKFSHASLVIVDASYDYVIKTCEF